MKFKEGMSVRVQRRNGRVSTGYIDKVWDGGKVLLVGLGKGSSTRWLNYSLRSNGRHVLQHFPSTENDYIIK